MLSQVSMLPGLGVGTSCVSRSETTTVVRRVIACSQKCPSGYMTCSPTMAQVPGAGIQPLE